MPPLKEQLSPDVVAALADELVRAWPDFPIGQFMFEACDGLTDRELKARVRQVVDALGRALPSDIRRLENVVARALVSPSLDGWMAWPFIDAVGERAIDHPERGLELLRLLTPRWSAEFAVRPFIEHHQAVAFERFAVWAGDPDPHVRRLVSEGTRPRLPWAPRLSRLVHDPSPSLPLLHRLRDDDSEYVRRSVANHVNDIAKDHPDLALTVAAEWLRAGGVHVEKVVVRALRGLVKAGDPRAIGLIGSDVDAPIDVVSFTVNPRRLLIGATTEVACVLVSRADSSVRAEVDVGVRYGNARGELTRRAVFKFSRVTLLPGEPTRLARSLAFVPRSIRALHPGTQRVELQVNGAIVASADVLLAAARTSVV